ncbi:sulfate ABC transporter ATPase, partial [Microcoleus sp. Pol14D6]
VVERQESSEYREPEPIVENLEVSETIESIDYSQPESEQITETPEEISDLEPEMQPVAEFLETVERQLLIEHPQPEPIVENLPVVAETVESVEHPQPEQVVENLPVVAETVESLEPS